LYASGVFSPPFHGGFIHLCGLSLAIKKLSQFEKDFDIILKWRYAILCIERLGCIAKRFIRLWRINMGNVGLRNLQSQQPQFLQEQITLFNK